MSIDNIQTRIELNDQENSDNNIDIDKKNENISSKENNKNKFDKLLEMHPNLSKELSNINDTINEETKQYKNLDKNKLKDDIFGDLISESIKLNVLFYSNEEIENELKDKLNKDYFIREILFNKIKSYDLNTLEKNVESKEKLGIEKISSIHQKYNIKKFIDNNAKQYEDFKNSTFVVDILNQSGFKSFGSDEEGNLTDDGEKYIQILFKAQEISQVPDNLKTDEDKVILNTFSNLNNDLDISVDFTQYNQQVLQYEKTTIYKSMSITDDNVKNVSEVNKAVLNSNNEDIQDYLNESPSTKSNFSIESLGQGNDNAVIDAFYNNNEKVSQISQLLKLSPEDTINLLKNPDELKSKISEFDEDTQNKINTIQSEKKDYIRQVEDHINKYIQASKVSGGIQHLLSLINGQFSADLNDIEINNPDIQLTVNSPSGGNIIYRYNMESGNISVNDKIARKKKSGRFDYREDDEKNEDNMYLNDQTKFEDLPIYIPSSNEIQTSISNQIKLNYKNILKDISLSNISNINTNLNENINIKENFKTNSSDKKFLNHSYQKNIVSQKLLKFMNDNDLLQTNQDNLTTLNQGTLNFLKQMEDCFDCRTVEKIEYFDTLFDDFKEKINFKRNQVEGNNILSQLFNFQEFENMEEDLENDKSANIIFYKFFDALIEKSGHKRGTINLINFRKVINYPNDVESWPESIQNLYQKFIDKQEAETMIKPNNLPDPNEKILSEKPNQTNTKKFLT